MTPLSTHMLDSAQRVMSSESCAGMWNGLAKRKTFGHQVSEDYPPIYALLVDIGMALRGPSEIEQIPKSKRKSSGTRMVKLIQSFRDEITQFISHEELPEEFVNPASKKSDEIVRVFYSSSFCEAIESAKKSPKERAEDERMVKEGAFLTILRALDVLDVWEKGAIAWSESTPVICRPKTKGAERAYFVRKLTDHFLCMYRTPFREHTLTLTSIFFDCTTLDASAIAKLAPCVETER